MVHPVTEKYVLCVIQDGIATVIDDHPTLPPPQSQTEN